MPIVAHLYPFVVGVDTHAREHVYAVIDSTTGALLDTSSFPTTSAGVNRAIGWVARRTDADADTLWVIEGSATYGAILAATVATYGYRVVEAPGHDGKKSRAAGKSDVLDAQRMARAVMGLPVDMLRIPRASNGVRQALRILVTARESMTGSRTRSLNALNALVRANNLGLDVRRKLTTAQIQAIRRWRKRDEELAIATARAEAVRLANLVVDLDAQLKANETELEKLVKASAAAPLLQETGFGTIAAAKCLVAWSHQGRVRNEAAFASLAGVNPIPASSGNIVRHRLNRGGDRKLNATFHMVAVNRMTHHLETRDYVNKRRAEGKTDREIRRCIKRYLARRVFKILSTTTLDNKSLQTT